LNINYGITIVPNFTTTGLNFFVLAYYFRALNMLVPSLCGEFLAMNENGEIKRMCTMVEPQNVLGCYFLFTYHKLLLRFHSHIFIKV